MKDKIDALSSFLSSKLNVDVSSTGNKLFVYSDYLSTSELQKLVNKFVYHNHLNHTYWVALEGNTVKIHMFKRAEKKEKQKSNIPATIRHGW
ncbi:MAG: hypothetical protein NWF06_00460 [Candidatus Bathyarchaeota archaeon]|nr:hypothetical protein [Candidatus Bathyarchaeum sp.]